MAPKKKRGGGRKSHYTPDYCERANEFALAGFTDEEMAKAFDIDIRNFYRWCSKYPKFRQSINSGKHIADAKVAKSLYNRAIGMNFPDIHIGLHDGQPVITRFQKALPPDVRACVFWLMNRRRVDYQKSPEPAAEVSSTAVVNINMKVGPEEADLARLELELHKRGALLPAPTFDFEKR